MREVFLSNSAINIAWRLWGKELSTFGRKSFISLYNSVMNHTKAKQFCSGGSIESPFFHFFSSGDVAVVRRQFSSSVFELPNPIGAELNTFWQMRVLRAEGDPLLGEKLPIMLGELLGVTKDESIRLAVAWLHIYSAILLVDDMLDGDLADKDGSFTMAAPLLIAKGERLLCQNALNAEKISLTIYEALRACSAATIEEKTFYKTGRPRSLEREIEVAAKKIASVDICLEAFSQASHLSKCELEARLQHVVAFIDSAKLAFQLLDDITDIRSDESQHHITLPLRSFSREALRDGMSADDAFWLEVVGSGDFSHTLKLSLTAVEDCVISLGKLGVEAKSVIRYFEWLHREVNIAHSQADLLLKTPTHLRSPTDINVLKKQLIVVAQTT